MDDPNPIAIILASGRKQSFGSLLQAIRISDDMRASKIQHRLLTLDMRGEYTDVGKNWEPDCVCENDNDTYGGIVENQWEGTKK